MDDKYHLNYCTPHTYCRCRNKYNKLTLIARNYKTFYDKIKEGKSGSEALNSMEIYKMCCRQRYLTIPLEHMIDRSKDRFFKDLDNYLKKESTRILEPKIQPPDFPILPS